MAAWLGLPRPFGGSNIKLAIVAAVFLAVAGQVTQVRNLLYSLSLLPSLFLPASLLAPSLSLYLSPSI